MLRYLSTFFRARPRPRPSRVRPLTLERLEEREVLSVTPEGQLFVYLLNRARSNPAAYQQEVNLPISLASVAARPPLAVNNDLFNSSGFKANEMATNNYFSHQSAVTGIWPNQLVRNNGYPLPDLFVNNANYLESISYGGSTLGHNPAVASAAAALQGLIIDAGINPPGHRIHLLGMDAFNATFKEIGVGHAVAVHGLGDYDYWTIHTGYVNTTDTFLTGVVYNDLNGNHRYDLNEGQAGVTVHVGNLTTTTNSAGGWSIQVNPSASYTVTASGAGFVGQGSAQVNVGTDNVEVDFISGQSGAQVNFSDSSGSTGATNSAPTLGAVPALTAIAEDNSTSIGDLVSKLTASMTVANLGAKKGIAVTTVAGVGTWQYFDGLRWNSLTGVSDSAAVLLPDTDRLRFLPSPNWNGQASLTFRAWDRTTGLPGQVVDLSAASSVGGTTAFSATEATTTVDVLPVNDAPVLPSITLTLPAISRLQTNPAGVSVSSLLTGATDVDSANLGVALTGTLGTGTWQYSQDGGQSWKSVGLVNRFSGRLLGGSDLVRFVPAITFNGTASLTFFAWDQSKGTDGSLFLVPAVLGGSTPFSLASRTAQLLVNDAPTLGAAPALTTIIEDQVTMGDPVSKLTAGITDSDPLAKKGIAVTAVAGVGTWQYFDGIRWNNLSAVADNAARLLPDYFRLRFLPSANSSGQATLTFRAWDRTTGMPGQVVDLSSAGSVGGQTSYSATQATTTLNVLAVNDAPVLPSTTPTLPAISRLNTNPAGIAVSSLLAGATDADSPDLGVALFATRGTGTWQFSQDSGQGWQSVGAVNRLSGRLLRGSDLVRFVPASTFVGMASLMFFAWDQTKGTAGSLFPLPIYLGGSTPFSLAARTLQFPVA